MSLADIAALRPDRHTVHVIFLVILPLGLLRGSFNAPLIANPADMHAATKCFSGTATSACVGDRQPNARRTDLHGDLLPGRAVARLGTTRFRHAARIEELEFLPNGKTLASRAGEGENALRIWDLSTHKEKADVRLSTGTGVVALF